MTAAGGNTPGGVYLEEENTFIQMHVYFNSCLTLKFTFKKCYVKDPLTQKRALTQAIKIFFSISLFLKFALVQIIHIKL